MKISFECSGPCEADGAGVGKSRQQGGKEIHMASSPSLIPVLTAETAPVQSLSAMTRSCFASSSVQYMFTCESSDTYPLSLFALGLNKFGSASEACSCKQSKLARLNSINSIALPSYLGQLQKLRVDCGGNISSV